MLAIAIALLFTGLAVLACSTIAVSIAKGVTAGRAMLAELAELQGGNQVTSPTLPAFRSRARISPQGYSRQPLRPRPLQRACAAA